MLTKGGAGGAGGKRKAGLVERAHPLEGGAIGDDEGGGIPEARFGFGNDLYLGTDLFELLFKIEFVGFDSGGVGLAFGFGDLQGLDKCFDGVDVDGAAAMGIFLAAAVLTK